ncbi:TetR/AcrR family transcriptional regulator [Parasphingopyxis sp.]|uniref:TetR/AcrR family transcriptional regulator n=1 Tax=Parasphingopyxis sp. TaxID=1920299 RepID=UPI00263A3AE1|nr:TetR/AcrR family transcriptional regulator [Parasphingopyxis sp.]
MAESTTRSVNKQRRRDAILGEAQRVIGEQGFDALNLRALAEAASVTVPTIYNLIGSKDAVLVALIEQAVTRIEDALESFGDVPALEQAEAVVIQSTAIFEADENFFRAAMIAGEHIDSREDHLGRSGWIHARSTEMAAQACRAGQREGLLRGDIASGTLGEQMYALYRTALYDWTHRMISIEEFRCIALRGFYVCMAADATDAFRTTLLDRIAALAESRVVVKAA